MGNNCESQLRLTTVIDDRPSANRWLKIALWLAHGGKELLMILAILVYIVSDGRCCHGG